ncbi:recombinase RecT [Ruegeria lacuscaerulensis]|uniref:recombinase RecT n=1 Tax=Ruegeria lacuscaerulensis TaxID=55218 RepID=UPI001480E439|nr:recombinase RecT [Ruegeria lacuscaerulensis]
MNAPATQSQLHPVVRFKQDLDKLQTAGELALPDSVPFKAFKNAAVVAVTDNPGILNCKPASVFKAVRTLAGAGLVPDGREAAIVPFKGEAQAMPMVAGLVKVARNTGKVASLWAEVVYEGETLEVWVEDGERKWNHVNEDGSRLDAMERGGEIRGAYAVAKLTDGTVEFQPMSRAEIEKRRKASANQKSDNPTGIWEKWYDQMALKTVIRNLCKRLPMSTEDMDRIMTEQDQPEPIRDVTPEVKPNLAQRLQQQNTEEAETPEQEPGQPIDGEILPPEEDVQDEPDIDPSELEFAEGVSAANDGKAVADCPYDDDQLVQKAHWLAGFKRQSKLNSEAGA